MHEAVFIVLGSCAVPVLIVFIIARSKSEAAAYRAQVQEKLIARFNSGPELVEFLQSPTGKQYLGEAAEAPKHRAYDRILASIRNAIILGFLGFAFVGIGIAEHDYDWFYPGFILTGLGIGFLVAAIVSRKLSKAWGILDPQSEPYDGTTR